MKEQSKETKMKPILFSTEMVKAILAGNKTQTRRVVPKRVVDEYRNYEKFREKVSSFAVLPPQGPECDYYLSRARYQVGDILYVRETWLKADDGYKYKADVREGSEADELRKQYGYKWQPSLFMPKAAARLFLRVTDVDVARLQDISEADANKEGVMGDCAVARFTEIWDIINTKRPGCSWADNPWVFVISFERIEK